MKLSKSILSPNHRLKTSSTIKSTTNKKQRGSSFENPEPSSPKVTCIGQVKLKTKKKVKQSRTSNLSSSSSSFRAPGGIHVLNQQCVAHRNQRWVHFPLTICEALREFSCLFPCRSSCLYKEKKEKINRWLVVLQENPGQNGERKDSLRSSRRHVFEDIEFKDDEKEDSVVIPPKNALLLMRCRSDPTKMADLTTRFEELHDEEGNEHVEGQIDAHEKCKISGETENDSSVHKTLMKENDIPELEEFVAETCLFEEIGEEERKSDAEKSENGTKLPDCLLLMMFEPKLSMEVSRETWVCKSDFILPAVNKETQETTVQCTKHPEDIRKQMNEEPKMISIESKPARVAQDSRSQRLMQPPRSSCSLSMATMIEQKLVNAAAYEPFVLTRCKSEPMRMVALGPESCFGAAGIGF